MTSPLQIWINAYNHRGPGRLPQWQLDLLLEQSLMQKAAEPRNRGIARDNMYEAFVAELEVELDRLPKSRKPTEGELKRAIDKISGRIGDKMQDVFREQVKNAYMGGLRMVERDFRRRITFGKVHEDALRQALKGTTAAQSFKDFSKQTSKRLNEIVTEGYKTGRHGSRAIAQRMVDEVGWEARSHLETIARSETYKVWETAQYTAYRQMEEERGEEYLYVFGHKDTKTCKLCAKIHERVGKGKPLKELRKIIVQTSKEFMTNWDPLRDTEWPLPHPNCRDGFYRVVDDVRKAPIEYFEMGEFRNRPTKRHLAQARSRGEGLYAGYAASDLREGSEGVLVTDDETGNFGGAGTIRRPDKKHLWAQLVGTDPGKGYGRQLMERVMDQADKEGLPVLLESEGSGQFFEHMGFKPWDPNKDFVPDHLRPLPYPYPVYIYQPNSRVKKSEWVSVKEPNHIGWKNVRTGETSAAGGIPPDPLEPPVEEPEEFSEQISAWKTPSARPEQSTVERAQEREKYEGARAYARQALGNVYEPFRRDPREASQLMTAQDEQGNLQGVMSWDVSEDYPEFGNKVIVPGRLGTNPGRGYGRKLMTQLAQEAVDRDLPIVLEPAPDAISFYSHLGFDTAPSQNSVYTMIMFPDRARALLAQVQKGDCEFARVGMGPWCTLPRHCNPSAW